MINKNIQIQIARELGVIEGMGQIMVQSGTSEATRHVGGQIVKIVGMLETLLLKYSLDEVNTEIPKQEISIPIISENKPIREKLTDEERKRRRREYQRRYLAKKCDYENCSGRSTFIEGTGVVLGKKNFCRPVCRDLYQKREDEKLTGQEEGVQA